MLGAGGGGCSPAARPCRPPTHSSAVSRVSRLSPAMSAASVFPRRFQDGFQKRIGFSSCFHALSAAACYYCSFPPPPTGSVARRARSRAALTQASVPPLCFPADTAPSLCATPTVIAAASRNLLSVKTRRGKVFTKQRHYFHPHCSTV